MFQSLSARLEVAPPTGLGVCGPAAKWHALWAMMVGFFMILLDATIVAVANPTIMEELGADYDGVIWVTSAYLLAYAVPCWWQGGSGMCSGRRISTLRASRCSRPDRCGAAWRAASRC